MATRYGYQTYLWLLNKGWKPVPINHEVFGDNRVIDSETGESVDVYSAAKLQRDRTGEYPEFLFSNKL